MEIEITAEEADKACQDTQGFLEHIKAFVEKNSLG